MRRKLTKTIRKLFAISLLICSLTACAENTNVSTQNEIETIEPSVETASSEPVLSENITEPEENADSCPEGYVYDYQVSMDPIPEEIAALGGTCQGTIHAFPSRIEMALTELEMEKDPVLKAEVEKRIPEIIAALEEEIGGEFVVDGVIVKTNMTWKFICTEVKTGYQFDLSYANKEYEAQIENRKTSSNIINVECYCYEKESEEVREQIFPIIEEIFGDVDCKIRTQGKDSTIDIVIVQYKETEVDKLLEQKKILGLWEKLQLYNENANYNLSLAFFPQEYETVIEEKFTTVLREDFGSFFNDDAIAWWMANEECYGCMHYSEFSNESDINNLDVLQGKYQLGEYNENMIWEYWICR